MKKLEHFLFYQQLPEISINKFFFVDVTDIKSKEELLYSYYQAFNFPSYFGFNWDALYDALCHLDKWLEEKKYLSFIKICLVLEKMILKFIFLCYLTYVIFGNNILIL